MVIFVPDYIIERQVYCIVYLSVSPSPTHEQDIAPCILDLNI